MKRHSLSVVMPRCFPQLLPSPAPANAERSQLPEISPTSIQRHLDELQGKAVHLQLRTPTGPEKTISNEEKGTGPKKTSFYGNTEDKSELPSMNECSSASAPPSGVSMKQELPQTPSLRSEFDSQAHPDPVEFKPVVTVNLDESSEALSALKHVLWTAIKETQQENGHAVQTDSADRPGHTEDATPTLNRQMVKRKLPERSKTVQTTEQPMQSKTLIENQAGQQKVRENFIEKCEDVEKKKSKAQSTASLFQLLNGSDAIGSDEADQIMDITDSPLDKLTIAFDDDSPARQNRGENSSENVPKRAKRTLWFDAPAKRAYKAGVDGLALDGTLFAETNMSAIEAAAYRPASCPPITGESLQSFLFSEIANQKAGVNFTAVTCATQLCAHSQTHDYVKTDKLHCYTCDTHAFFFGN